MKWIFFDLDDTLWNFSANSLVALRRLYENNCILIDIYSDFDAFADAYHEVNDRMWAAYHAGRISAEFLKCERFRELLGDESRDARRLALEWNDSYLDMLCEGTCLVEGAIELLSLVSNDSLIAILSNGFLNTQYKKLKAEGIWRYVQRMIISEEIGIQKPDRRLFEYALAETGAALEDAILVGDNPDADIAGAIRAGWKAVYVDRKGKPLPDDVVQSPKVLKVERLADVPDAIARLKML